MKLNDAIEKCKKGYSVILHKDDREYLLKEVKGEYFFVNITLFSILKRRTLKLTKTIIIISNHYIIEYNTF